MIRDVLFGEPIVIMGVTLTVWAGLALLLVVAIGQASRDSAFDVARTGGSRRSGGRSVDLSPELQERCGRVEQAIDGTG